MVHIGSAPPHLDEILALMEKGDVLTHCFNGKALAQRCFSYVKIETIRTMPDIKYDSFVVRLPSEIF
jgi:hypothetical protein